MSTHPGDTAQNRFRAALAGLLAFVSFGAVLWIALRAGGDRVPVEAGAAERAVERAKNLAEVRTAQVALVPAEKIDAAMKSALTALQAKKAAKTDLIVPGSPTFLKQAPAATPTPAPAPATPAPAPATPAPAPATPAPAPATPAPAPATPAPAPATPAPAPATPAPAPAK